MTSDEWRDAMIMVDALDASQLGNELIALAKYEFSLLDNTDPSKKELRDILLFRAAIFTAAGMKLGGSPDAESSSKNIKIG